jgi:hypothetical protein
MNIIPFILYGNMNHLLYVFTEIDFVYIHNNFTLWLGKLYKQKIAVIYEWLKCQKLIMDYFILINGNLIHLEREFHKVYYLILVLHNWKTLIQYAFRL